MLLSDWGHAAFLVDNDGRLGKCHGRGILLGDVISMVEVPTPSALDELSGAYPRTKPEEHMRERWSGGMRKSGLERVEFQECSEDGAPDQRTHMCLIHVLFHGCNV